MIYLINPRKGRRMAKRKRTTGRRKRRTPAQVAATRKMIAANKRKRRGASKSKRRAKAPTTTTKRRKSMARRKSTRRRTTSRKRGRRRSSSGTIRLKRVRGQVYLRNPSIIKQVQQGLMDAVKVKGGQVAARTISNALPLPKTGIAGIAVTALTAVGVGMAARKFLGADTARFIVAGAMQPVISDLVTTFVPAAAPLLGEFYPMGYVEDGMDAYPSVEGEISSYPEELGSYPGVASIM